MLELANKKRTLKRYLTLIDVQQPSKMQEYLAGPTDKGATLLLDFFTCHSNEPSATRPFTNREGGYTRLYTSAVGI